MRFASWDQLLVVSNSAGGGILKTKNVAAMSKGRRKFSPNLGCRHVLLVMFSAEGLSDEKESRFIFRLKHCGLLRHLDRRLDLAFLVPVRR